MTQDPSTDAALERPGRSPAASATRPVPRERSFDRDHDPVEFGRVVTLTDGVFAIALTLLVLDLALPAGSAGAPPAVVLTELAPQFVAFVISVAVVGTFFHSHHELVRMLQRFDATLTGLTVPYLGLVALIPFAQGLLVDSEGAPLAFALYGVVLGCAAGVEAGMLWHAHRRGLLRYELRGRVARFRAARAALPVAVFFTSAGLALLVGEWTVLLWFALWPLDSALVRFEQRGAP